MLLQQPEPGCVVARAVVHLPAVKQQQLCAIVGIIRATADVERVVLYGSHARGDWVEDPGGGYLSDFDILVLVTSPALAADESLWADCQDRARDAVLAERAIDDTIAAVLRLACAAAAIPIGSVTVVASFAHQSVDNGIAAELCEAIHAAAVAGLLIPIIALFAKVLVHNAVAAEL
jgi:predicted nucleotidyltransferase